jgi:putative serine protease PepD
MRGVQGSRGAWKGQMGMGRLAWAVAPVVAALCGAAEAREPRCTLGADKVFTMTAPSVVQVQSITINPYLVHDRVDPRVGSGFVIEGGLVLTSYHIVADAEEAIVFTDAYPLMAEVMAIDPTLDIAVLRPVSDVIVTPPLEFAAASDIVVGQTVFDIGYPLGIGKSISAGIVSGLGRTLPDTTSSWLSPYIQTDAAVSPGNSGGPLLDACGRVVGLVSSIITGHGAANIGFAIPVEVLGPAVEALVRDGHVARPWHGLYGQMVTPDILMMLGASPFDLGLTGFLVETVEPGSAADLAGLRGGVWPVMWGPTEILLGGDIVTAVNGVRIDTLERALEVVKGLRIGQTVKIEALRDGQPFEASVVLEERPLIERELELYRYSPGR